MFSTDSSRWDAVVHRDKEAEGCFYYAVKTTGVFCRPGCSSRLPNRKNVTFYETIEAAENDGFRPCKRCKPGSVSQNEHIESIIIQACRSIEQAEIPLKLDDLAAAAGLSPYHFHRLFKKIVGVTPKQYSSTHQSQRFRNSLKDSPSVTDAIYKAGYSSSSRAYEKAQEHLAMAPKTYRGGAAGVTIYYGTAQCLLGWVIVALTERGICAIELGDDPKTLFVQLQKNYPKAQLEEVSADFSSLLKEVASFIETPSRGIKVPLDIQGTAFQQRVWSVLQEIEPGTTLSYTELAERVGNPEAARAVAKACGSNRLAVVIPCHRVVAKDGRMGGFRWGVERKAQLLDKEKEWCTDPVVDPDGKGNKTK